MEFDLTPYAVFAAEVKDWCRARWPNGIGPRVEPGLFRGEDWATPFRAGQRALGEQGWLCGGWPIAYGGGGWAAVKQAVFNELAAYHRIPGAGIPNIGVSTVGPTIMRYGSVEQKETLLPQLARGELIWAQGFSEPNAGSDLASLQTRAIQDDDTFVVNGSKIWSHGRFADYLLLLARTEPTAEKHRGLSQLIVPLRDTPGISVRPILDLLGRERWTLITFENARLPGSALLGERDRGWYQAVASLDFERSQIGWVGEARRTLEDLITFSKRTRRHGEPLLARAQARERLGGLATELEMARWLAYRVAFLQDQGEVPNVEASMSKVWASEVHQRVHRIGLELAGPLGMLTHESAWRQHDGLFDEDYWAAPAPTIAGGTSEIQRNVLATRGLGLPR